MTTNGFPADGLQFTHMHMKSAQEALAEALELNPTPMSARFPLHEGKEKRECDRIAFVIHFATGCAGS